MIAAPPAQNLLGRGSKQPFPHPSLKPPISQPCKIHHAGRRRSFIQKGRGFAAQGNERGADKPVDLRLWPIAARIAHDLSRRFAEEGACRISGQIFDLDDSDRLTSLPVGDHQVRPIRRELHPIGSQSPLQTLFGRFHGGNDPQRT